MLGAGILLILTAPVLGLRLGFSDEGNYAEETTTRQAYDILAEGFGPGFNGPFLVTARAEGVDGIEQMQTVAAAVAADGEQRGGDEQGPSDCGIGSHSRSFALV